MKWAKLDRLLRTNYPEIAEKIQSDPSGCVKYFVDKLDNYYYVDTYNHYNDSNVIGMGRFVLRLYTYRFIQEHTEQVLFELLL